MFRPTSEKKMTYYIPPDYLDNIKDRSLAETLRQAILIMQQDKLDVATGFFHPDVWSALGTALPELQEFRLLLGKAPELESPNTGTIDLHAHYRHKLQGDLETLPFNPKYAALIDGLLEFLRRDSVQIKLYPRFLHAKAYIFPRLAIVGSSNFTGAGLHREAELNMVNKSDTVAKSLKEEWFEPFWNQAEEYKDELLRTLEESKFGTAPYTPFDVLIKALYEYFKDRLAAEHPEAHLGVNLATFQQEGLREAVRLLDRHRGVIVADAVGLGKTYIGMGLLEHYLLRHRSKGRIPRGLIICPAQLRDLVWLPKLDEYGIKAVVRSMEEISRVDFPWQDYRDYDFVLVDEAHNFRNPGTGRYQNLHKLISTGKREKYVALMTATPINNSIWDLYHQIMLITRGSESYYRDYGFHNLKGYFQRVSESEVELFDLLEQTTVRRSRYDIKKRQQAGEIITLPGKGEIHFPERELCSINYSLENTYRGFYNEISEQIEKLALVSYNIDQFRRAPDKESQLQVQRNNALIGILKTTLFKRLESSLRAFEVSVDRQAKFQERFFKLFQQGRLLSSPDHRKLLALEADDADDATIQEFFENLEEVDSAEYDMEAIRKELESDQQALADMLGWTKIIRESVVDSAQQDAKLCALKDELVNHLKGRKVLIFTYYEDTAAYLFKSLKEDAKWLNDAGNPNIEVISGRTSRDRREELVKRFAPVANTPDTEEGLRERTSFQNNPIDILVSTDVLSEGQNLQDAGNLINYDLHWNPVRMIQRAGRIDRLGSPYETLSICNCFPEEGLESLLRLVERLQQRIADIDRTVGLDASVLGEIIHPKSLEDLRRIKRGEKAVLDEYERAAELVSADDMKFPLLEYLQLMGEERVQQIPMGIHSGKRSRLSGTFFAFKARDHHFWRLYPSDGSKPLTEIRRIYKVIECNLDEPRVVPEHNIFPLLEQATGEILQEIKSRQATTRIRPQLQDWNRDFYNALQQPELGVELTEDVRKRVSEVLMNVSLRPFKRDRKLKEINSNYRQSKNTMQLLQDLDAWLVENDLYRDYSDPTQLEQIKEEDLQLVCYELLS
jgi:hypothetical protein